MRQLAVLMLLCCVGVAGFVVVSRMAAESRVLLAGIVIGCLSSVPASIAAVLIAGRTTERAPVVADPARRQAPLAPPPVVIVSPGQSPRNSRYAPYIDHLLEAPQPRTFTIVGEPDS